jgi:hypothetical protein
MKTICIDYDGTYTEMPDLLDCIIKKSKELGYRVILATMRYEHESNDDLKKVINKVDSVYFTGRKAKATYLQWKGIVPDLWIDDNPFWLLNDSK